MGWSCTAKVSETMQKLEKGCIAQTGSQNAFKANGMEYFWELSNREYECGKATGKIVKINREGFIAGSTPFEIAAGGEITKGAKLLKPLLEVKGA